MLRYPVPVADGAPGDIIERADKALKETGINSAKRYELRAAVSACVGFIVATVVGFAVFWVLFVM